MIEGIILAAGKSSRMIQLKPLMEIAGKPFLQHILDALTSANIHVTHTVVGYRSDLIIEKTKKKTHCVRNEQYNLGQFSSLQTGIKALSPDCTAALVCLGDQPQIESTWIETIVQAFKETNAIIVRPSFQGRSGHPLLLKKSLFDEILSMSPTDTAKTLLKNHIDQTLFVDIDSDAILYDADTPGDVTFISKFMSPSNE